MKNPDQKPEWWMSMFNDVYLKTDKHVMTEEITKKEVNEILEVLKISKNSSVLDLCCGQGRHLIELYRQGYRKLSGLDYSEYLISIAKNENENINFKSGDIRLLDVDARFDSYDYITFLGNSFGYFEDESHNKLILEKIYNKLNDGGKLLIDLVDCSWMKNNFKKNNWEYIENDLLVCRDREISEGNGSSLLSTNEIVIDRNKGVISDKNYKVRMYTYPMLEDILLSSGFEKIKKHSSKELNVNKNIDSGMMSNRLLISASKR